MVQTRKNVVVVDSDEEEDDINNFDLVRVDNHKLKFKDGTETKVFKYSSKDKKTYLEIEDVGLLYEELKTVFDADKIQIRGLADKWITLLNFGQKNILQEEDMDNYFKGKVEDTSKFKTFSQLLITVSS